MNPPFLSMGLAAFRPRATEFYSNIENLVLRARSEITSSAENKYPGQLEHWNIGTMGPAE
jgi:hypothetical protein